MARLRPIGIPPEEQEPPYAKTIPDRVQKLIDLYAKNHVVYPWTEMDRQEQIFEYRRSRKSTSYKYDIDAIYRVRDARDKSKEYYFYQKTGRVLNDNNIVERTNSMTYGYLVEREHELKWNQAKKGKEPVRIRDNPTYLLPWNKEEARKLLEGSEKSCLNFYVGTAGSTGQGDESAKDISFIKDQNDFLEGNFEDLAILSKSGMMKSFGSSLHLIERAKKRLEEKAFGKIEGSEIGTEIEIEREREKAIISTPDNDTSKDKEKKQESVKSKL